MAEEIEPVRLQINDQLQITIKDTDEEIPTTYLSRVEDFNGEDVVIGWPTNRGVRAPVHPGEVLAVSYNTGVAILAVDARIIAREQEPIPLLTVRIEGESRRIQRREHVRVPALVEVELRARIATPVKIELGEADPNIISTRTFNLSGGGFAIKHGAQPRVGNLYDVKLTLPDVERPFNMTAKVVRVESVLEAERKNYMSGFAFIQLSETLRRQIISFIFRFQQNSVSKE